MSEELREKIARVIDPSRWAVLDGYLADMLRKYKGEHIGYDPESFKDKASLAKADSILALIDHLEADGGVEAMRERCAKAAEDRFEYVRKGVPDSDFLEAARLIAEDIRALPVLGVGR